MRHFAPILALAALLLPGIAKAQSVDTVVTACVNSPEADFRVQAQLCARLGALLHDTDGIRVASEDSLLNSGAAYSPRVVLSDTREMLTRAKDNLNAGDAALAAKQSEEVVQTMLAMEPWLGSSRSLDEAFVLQVTAALATDNAGRAQAVALRALTLSGNLRRSWSGSITNPAARAVFASAHARFRALPRGGQLEILCRQDAAEVYVNGGLAGVTPLRLTDLPEGEHIVRVRKRGHVPVATLVRVTPGARSAVDVDLAPARYLQALEPLKGGITREVGDIRAGPALRELGSLLITDRIVALRTSPAAQGILLEGYLYDMRSGQLLTQASRTLRTTGPRAQQEAIRALTSTLFNLVIAETETEDESGAFYEQWWFWTGVGTATAALLTVAVVQTIDEPPPRTGKGRIEIRP